MQKVSGAEDLSQPGEDWSKVQNYQRQQEEKVEDITRFHGNWINVKKQIHDFAMWGYPYYVVKVEKKDSTSLMPALVQSTECECYK